MPRFQETLLFDESSSRKTILTCVLFTWTTTEISLEKYLLKTWTSQVNMAGETGLFPAKLFNL